MNKNKIFLVLFSIIFLSGCTLQSPIVIDSPTISPIKPTSAIFPTPTPTVDETSIIISAIKQALVAKHGPDASNLTITVSKIIGDYSSGGASEQGGGGMWFAAKVNGLWKLVWDGNGTIDCQDLANYPNYPVSLISECYNPQTGKSVKR